MSLTAPKQKRETLGIIFLLVGLLFSSPIQADDLVIGPFGTLNNKDSSLIIPSNQAQDLLNVDITPGGKSFKKREGYAISSTLSITTSPVHGTYSFFDSNGNDVALFFNDTRMTSSVGGASATVLFSTGANGVTYQCVDAEGFAYCANTARTNIIKTNGATYSLQTVVSTGTMLAITQTRLVQAGYGSDPNRIDFSKKNDFATWTVGGDATDPIQFTITSPGARITHITYAFNRIMWFKNNSFGYILEGATLADWTVKVVSPNLGTLDNTSVYWNGILYFRGQEGHLYSYDGSNLTKLTRDIGGTIDAAQSRASNSWTQTTLADWQAGANFPAGWVSTSVVSGSLVLDTATAVSPFSDTSASDFGSAFSVTNLDTTTASGSVSLNISSNSARDQQYGADDDSTGCGSGCNYLAQSFTASGAYRLTSVTLRIKKDGAPSGYSVSIYSDSSNSPGSSLVSASIPESSVSTSFSDVTILLSTISIVSGTRYWVVINGLIPCTAGSARIVWSLANGSFTESSRLGSTCANITVSNFNFKSNGYIYLSPGNFVSRNFDMGFDSAEWLFLYSTFTAGSSVNGQTITYEVQSSVDGSTFDSLQVITSGNVPSITPRRYVRYKASFSTTDTSTSSVLNSITFATTSRLRPGATFYSAVKNASNLTAWDTFSVTKQENGGTHTFSIRSSTNPIQLASSTPTWTSISAGAIPSIATGTYFQIKDQFDATVYTQNPKLDDFTQNWFEGTATDKSYASYFDDAIWWSLASGAGATANNTIIHHDLLNNGQTIYDIPINGFYLRNQNLYFGSATSGYIFKFGGVDNDNGSAIEAYWKSKDFFTQNPFIDNDFTSLSISGTSVANSSTTVTYTLNGSSSTAYTVSMYNANSSFTNNNRALVQGSTGKEINVKIGNNAVDQPFEIFGIKVGFTPKSWTPK